MSGVAVCAHGGCLVCVVGLGCPCAIGGRGATLCYLGNVSMQKGSVTGGLGSTISLLVYLCAMIPLTSLSLSLSPPPVIGWRDGRMASKSSGSDEERRQESSIFSM